MIDLTEPFTGRDAFLGRKNIPWYGAFHVHSLPSWGGYYNRHPFNLPPVSFKGIGVGLRVWRFVFQFRWR